jgi:hypothetical protein
MRNSILGEALNATMESEEGNQDLLEALIEESNELAPEQYVVERSEAEADIEIMAEQASVLEGEVVSQEQIDTAIAVVNAAAGRYGFRMNSASFESYSDPKEQAVQVAATIRTAQVAMESALDVSMEEYSVRDLWDHLNLLNREIPLLNDRITVLKNYSGNAKIMVGHLLQLFRVDGEVVTDFTAAAKNTTALINTMLQLGNEAVDAASRAATIAYGVDWSDVGKSEEALRKIASIKNPAKDLYDKIDGKWTLGNRKLSVKYYDVKGAADLGAWAKSASLNVSWPKVPLGQIMAGTLGGDIGNIIYQLVQGTKKRNINVPELTSALETFKGMASQSAAIRNNAPKKWRQHELMVKKLKNDVKGSSQAKTAVRIISEMDRMGWQCLNGTFTIIYFIIREINDTADKVIKRSKG